MKKFLISLLCVMMVFCMMPGMAFAEGEAQGRDFTGYTSADSIWGETWGNAKESFVIKVLDAYGNVMGTTSLNNVGGIIDGDVEVTWNLKLDAASNTDEYWTMAWTTAPSVDNIPAKVELWVDRVKVSGGDVVLNAPDAITPIFAAKTDENGKFTSYITEAAGLSSISDGDNVAILVPGTYAVPTGKDVTITGAVDGVVFDNIGACGMGGADVTFNNVTFDYYPNTNYTGLQHSGNLVYNNCTINGQVFLYGASETFNNCTFNQNSADAYNVWTYGAKEVEFNGCTLNSAGKSVLVYNEGGPATELDVVKSTFNASETVSGKAAIEIDTSAPNAPGEMDGTVITIDEATTATGFSNETKSGSSLWNDKKVDPENANGGGTTSKVIVNSEIVKAPYIPTDAVARIGAKYYTSLEDALNAAAKVTGEVTIELVDDVEWVTGSGHGSTPLIPEGAPATRVTIDGKGIYTLTATGAGVGSLRAANGATLAFKDLNIVDESVSYAENSWEFTYLEFAGNLEFENCIFNSGISLDTDNGQAAGVDATFTNCTFTSPNPSEYAVWVGHGTAVFNGCEFKDGTRGLKVHEAYGSDVATLEVNNCTFENLSEKPGIAVGTLNRETVLVVDGCEFINCQPGDQGNYMYETDTDLSTIIYCNLVDNVSVTGEITGGTLVDNTATNGEAAICYELLNVGNNSDVKVELYKGTELLMTKSRHFDNGGTITCS